MLKEKIQKIEFIDLHAQRKALENNVNQIISRIIDQGTYILGPEVKELEDQLSAYTGAQEVVTCSNGTDALRLLLLAHGVGPGDAVFVPTFTFASTAEVVAQSNATPVFVDICPVTYNMDPQSLHQAIASLDRKLTPKGIIAVDLFGLPADYPKIHEVATAHGLFVIADAAQSFGGERDGKKVGNLAQMTATSFFPSKPLACYGDGGALFLNDKGLADLIRSLRNHGCGAHRYDHIHIGMNSRLDTLQAAILLEKLKIFPNEVKARQRIAQFYGQALKDYFEMPATIANVTHAFGLYTIGCKEDQRESIMTSLSEQNIPCQIYYRKPLHLQPAYRDFPRAKESLKNAEVACNKVLSLPMHPYLTEDQLEVITDCVIEAVTLRD